MFLISDQPARNNFIKVCGVCNVEDALLCADLGVNAIGIILTKPNCPRKPGSDRLEPDEAATLVTQLPDKLKTVLLVHEVDFEEICRLAEKIKPNALQIQGDVKPNMLLKVKKQFPSLNLIKKISVSPDISVSELKDKIWKYIDVGAIDAVLLDSPRGGSGQVHDWEISAQLVELLKCIPVILAGGLNAENVADARRDVRPFGVDVMSGVTCPASRNKKDRERLHAFINAWHGKSADEH